MCIPPHCGSYHWCSGRYWQSPRLDSAAYGNWAQECIDQDGRQNGHWPLKKRLHPGGLSALYWICHIWNGIPCWFCLLLPAGATFTFCTPNIVPKIQQWPWSAHQSLVLTTNISIITARSRHCLWKHAVNSRKCICLGETELKNKITEQC